MVAVSLACIADDRLPPDMSRFHDRSVTVVDAGGQPLRTFQSRDEKWRLLTRPGDVDPLYLRMLLAYEDKRFAGHPGVDPLALVRAAGQAIGAGRVVSGASTLTMQAARLLEPRPRTVGSKLIEIGRALQLERRLGKQGVLTTYLTLAPFGGPLEGVRAASLQLFGKEPRVLTPAEAALLVALPQAPSTRRPDMNPTAAHAGRRAVLDRAVAAGIIDTETARRADRSPVPDRLISQHVLAWHLTDRVVAESADAVDRISTTLDAGLQAGVERRLGQVLEVLPPGVTAAVLVARADTAEVRALAGNADYFDAGRAGMVDLTNALRSPGSTLKPLIYALAFDRLVAAPGTLIMDGPWRVGGYRPDNFDGGHDGEVTIATALARSLNIPAVRVLDRLGPARFDAALDAAGIRLAFDRESGPATLPVALGGAGLRLSDLVRAYAGLAGDGRIPDRLAVRPGMAVHWNRLVGDAAADAVMRILADVPPPVGAIPDIVANRADMPAVAYKTGTSYGFRDAWAIGATRGHVVGVWVGRPDGSPCTGCTGRAAAAPILFDIARLLPVDATDRATVPARPAATPAHLRRFDAMRGNDPDRETVALAFPPDGAELHLASGQELPLVARGGRPPWRWLVDLRDLGDGQPGRNRLWIPDGPGLHDLMVLDADGNSATARVMIRPVRP